MALIKCPECRKEISEKAVSCPNCGFQLSEEIVLKIKADESIQKAVEEKEREKREYLDSLVNNNISKSPEISSSRKISKSDNNTPNGMFKKAEKGQNKKMNYAILLIIFLIASIFLITFIFIDDSPKESLSISSSKTQFGNVEPITMLKYEIYAKEDISVDNLNRMVFRILLDVESVPTVGAMKKVAIDVWNKGNRHWDEFTTFFYLPDMNLNNSAYAIGEFSRSELKSFAVGLREVGSKIDISINIEDTLLYAREKANTKSETDTESISIRKRKQIFYELVKYQDQTGDDVKAYSVIANRFGISEEEAYGIAYEGALNKWLMPDFTVDNDMKLNLSPENPRQDYKKTTVNSQPNYDEFTLRVKELHPELFKSIKEKILKITVGGECNNGLYVTFMDMECSAMGHIDYLSKVANSEEASIITKYIIIHSYRGYTDSNKRILTQQRGSFYDLRTNWSKVESALAKKGIKI